MIDQKLYEFVVLISLKKSPTFGESYNLVKILNWKFGFLDVRDLLKKMVENGLIVNNSSTGLYELTSIGEQEMYDVFSKKAQQLLNNPEFDRGFVEHLLKG